MTVYLKYPSLSLSQRATAVGLRLASCHTPDTASVTRCWRCPWWHTPSTPWAPATCSSGWWSQTATERKKSSNQTRPEGLRSAEPTKNIPAVTCGRIYASNCFFNVWKASVWNNFTNPTLFWEARSDWSEDNRAWAKNPFGMKPKFFTVLGKSGTRRTSGSLHLSRILILRELLLGKYRWPCIRRVFYCSWGKNSLDSSFFSGSNRGVPRNWRLDPGVCVTQRLLCYCTTEVHAPFSLFTNTHAHVWVRSLHCCRLDELLEGDFVCGTHLSLHSNK